jgi:hypothetical protein
MNKKTSTLNDLVVLIIFAVGSLAIMYHTNYTRQSWGEVLPVYETWQTMFRPSIMAFFFTWPFTATCALQALVMIYHLLLSGVVVHYRTSRIKIIFGLFLLGLSLSFITSPGLIFIIGGDTDVRTMLFFFNSWFMLIYACIEGSSLLLRFFNLGLEANDPSYKVWMERGGDPVIDVMPYFNPDGQAIRKGGLPEPKTQFVPPPEWGYQCTKCGARNESPTSCWFCHSLFPGAIPMAQEPAPMPRMLTCQKCQKFVKEAKFGDFEKGVICPFCNNTIYTENTDHTESLPCCNCGAMVTADFSHGSIHCPACDVLIIKTDPSFASKICYHCGLRVQETHKGDFDTCGVKCPNCQTILFTK